MPWAMRLESLTVTPQFKENNEKANTYACHQEVRDPLGQGRSRKANVAPESLERKRMIKDVFNLSSEILHFKVDGCGVAAAAPRNTDNSSPLSTS